MRRIPTLCVVAILLHSWAFAVSPPQQPDSGPGGNSYPHMLVKTSYHVDGSSRYWLYEPRWPKPESAPVLLFFSGIAGPGPYMGFIEHGFFAAVYERMFRHLARNGYIVVFPAYGPAGATIGSYEENAALASSKALRRLESFFHVSPELDRVAVGGHSFGGLVAMTVANRYEELELPQPRAIVCHEPTLVAQIETTCAADPGHPLCEVALPSDFSGIAADTVNVTIVGGRERMSEIGSTLEQWDLPQIPEDLKNLLFIHDDRRDGVGLVATHLSDGANPALPFPGFELNAIDWYGYWKPTVAVLDFAFRGENGPFVLGDGDEAKDMGNWSDGTPVTPMSTASDFDQPR